MLTVDHLAVSAATLAEGVERVEAALGVSLAPGGVHPHMGTHNCLLGLGPRLYLEVIAIDPDAPKPVWPRWFDLDRFAGQPRLTNWICRTDDLAAALARAPEGAGQPTALTRGPFRWQIAIPDNGRLPFDDAFPALIAWEGMAHPAAMLPDAGCRLHRLEIVHPEAEALRTALAPLVTDDRVQIMLGAEKSMRAEIDTPQGRRTL